MNLETNIKNILESKQVDLFDTVANTINFRFIDLLNNIKYIPRQVADKIQNRLTMLELTNGDVLKYVNQLSYDISKICI